MEDVGDKVYKITPLIRRSPLTTILKLNFQDFCQIKFLIYKHPYMESQDHHFLDHELNILIVDWIPNLIQRWL